MGHALRISADGWSCLHMCRLLRWPRCCSGLAQSCRSCLMQSALRQSGGSQSLDDSYICRSLQPSQSKLACMTCMKMLEFGGRLPILLGAKVSSRIAARALRAFLLPPTPASGKAQPVTTQAPTSRTTASRVSSPRYSAPDHSPRGLSDSVTPDSSQNFV